jgi:chorismate mutase
MYCRGIRGATTADSNTREDILQATDELLRQMIEANGIEPENVAYGMFTTTSDLDAEFPVLYLSFTI